MQGGGGSTGGGSQGVSKRPNDGSKDGRRKEASNEEQGNIIGIKAIHLVKRVDIRTLQPVTSYYVDKKKKRKKRA